MVAELQKSELHICLVRVLSQINFSELIFLSLYKLYHVSMNSL
jgi:hypothetical protein